MVLHDGLDDEFLLHELLWVGDDLHVIRVDLGAEPRNRLLDRRASAFGRARRACEQLHRAVVCGRRGQAAGDRAAADDRKVLARGL